jgi:hypothetical protein
VVADTLSRLLAFAPLVRFIFFPCYRNTVFLFAVFTLFYFILVAASVQNILEQLLMTGHLRATWWPV